MLNQSKFIEALQQNGVEFFTGVPDSFLNGFCDCVTAAIPPDLHVITANEGNAIAIATGYHLATGTVPLVYMQNSGMGNAVNPLLSLADRHVYSIPMLLLIGWRGQEGIDDHAQHSASGRLTLTLLDDMDIPYRVFSGDDEDEMVSTVTWSIQTARTDSRPVALVVPKGVCDGAKQLNVDDTYPMSRKDVIRIVINNCPADALYVVTTGRATRELYFLRKETGQDSRHDFLNVGAMGHSLSIAQGLALANHSRLIVCLDGDGSALMHMGSLAITGALKSPNLLHVVLNNGAHESVGGQPTVGQLIDFTKIAESCGYYTVGQPARTEPALRDALKKLLKRPGPAFIDTRIHKGIRKNLPPLDVSPVSLKEGFTVTAQKREVQKREMSG